MCTQTDCESWHDEDVGVNVDGECRGLTLFGEQKMGSEICGEDGEHMKRRDEECGNIMHGSL